jgi:Zn-finger nucleic acid-binding protein
MNCPTCGAPLRLEEGKDHFVCAYCGGLHFPEKNDDGVRVLGEPSGLQCPVCADGLAAAALNGRRVLYCERCRGMLVAMGVFVELIDELRARRGGNGAIPHAAASGEVQRHTVCPQCHRTMDTHYYAGPGNIVIDSCSPCHLNWLDHGELQRVILAPEGESNGGVTDV